MPFMVIQIMVMSHRGLFACFSRSVLRSCQTTMNARPGRPPVRTAFTLIELLVVIAIIGILASLLFPAVNSAILAARKTSAKNDVTQIATAVIAFEAEYGRLPVAANTNEAGQDVGVALINTLTGITTNDNPRKIVFLDAPVYKKGKGGVNSSSNYCDPFESITRNQVAYKIAMDYNYDNTLSSVGVPATSVRKRVAVWTATNAKVTTSLNSWD